MDQLKWEGWLRGAIGLVLAACGDGNARVVPDAGSGDPALVVQVAQDGNDAHDGLILSVETLKRALAIAAAEPRVRDIVLSAGTYSMRNGESFPYTVPRNVVGISGPIGGGAVLVGDGRSTGLILGDAQLQNLEFDGFTVAIEAAGRLRVKNLRVVDSVVAIHAEKTTALRIDNLDISGGQATACATGIRHDGIANLTVTSLVTRDLAVVVDTVSPPSARGGIVDIVGANVMNAPRQLNSLCPAVFSVSNHSFTLTDSVVDGGYFGVSFSGSTPPLPVTITNTAFRNFSAALLAVGGDVHVTGGSLTSNGHAVLAGGGSWSFTGVSISRNRTGIGISGQGAIHPAMLTMRRSIVSSNTEVGIDMGDNADADLGTSEDPGNNVIAANTLLGMRVGGAAGQAQIDAVDNTWNPSVQGADELGRYATVETLVSPIAQLAGNNYSIDSGWSLRR
jgi:hypothetical protein